MQIIPTNLRLQLANLPTPLPLFLEMSLVGRTKNTMTIPQIIQAHQGTADMNMLLNILSTAERSSLFGERIPLELQLGHTLEHARPAAVVNIEIPALVTVGFLFITAGFLIQFLSGPSP